MHLKRERLKEIVKNLDFIESFEIFCVGRNCDTCAFRILGVNCNHEELYQTLTPEQKEQFKTEMVTPCQ